MLLFIRDNYSSCCIVLLWGVNESLVLKQLVPDTEQALCVCVGVCVSTIPAKQNNTWLRSSGLEGPQKAVWESFQVKG